LQIPAFGEALSVYFHTLMLMVQLGHS
jgi:hypothetical protein